MHAAVLHIQECRTSKGGSLGFSIDGNFDEIRMDDIRKAVSEKLICLEDLRVIEGMFPKPVSLPNYAVTTQALICAPSLTSKRQSSHMDSIAPDLILQNAFYKFPRSQRLEEYRRTVSATVFKDMCISNQLHLETCDSSKIQQLFQVDWESLPVVGRKKVRQGDCVEFDGHTVHYGPGPEETSIEYLRVVAFQVNQPLGKEEEHPPEEEYQVRQYFPHFQRHPNLFYQNISASHPFWDDFCKHTPYSVMRAILKNGNVKRDAFITQKQILAYVNKQKKTVGPSETVDCQMCGPARSK